jgi:hypothetical protein
MHQVPRADQLELADAIAAGSCRRPSQAFGEYFSTKGGSCALGAAYEGAYALPQEAGSIRPRLDRLFDCLENVRRRCPEGCNKRLPLTITTGRANRSSPGCGNEGARRCPNCPTSSSISRR